VARADPYPRIGAHLVGDSGDLGRQQIETSGAARPNAFLHSLSQTALQWTIGPGRRDSENDGIRSRGRPRALLHRSRPRIGGDHRGNRRAVALHFHDGPDQVQDPLITHGGTHRPSG
jgi:hypothetical protein